MIIALFSNTSIKVEEYVKDKYRYTKYSDGTYFKDNINDPFDSQEINEQKYNESKI